MTEQQLPGQGYFHPYPFMQQPMITPNGPMSMLPPPHMLASAAVSGHSISKILTIVLLLTVALIIGYVVYTNPAVRKTPIQKTTAATLTDLIRQEDNIIVKQKLEEALHHMFNDDDSAPPADEYD